MDQNNGNFNGNQGGFTQPQGGFARQQGFNGPQGNSQNFNGPQGNPQGFNGAQGYNPQMGGQPMGQGYNQAYKPVPESNNKVDLGRFLAILAIVFANEGILCFFFNACIGAMILGAAGLITAYLAKVKGGHFSIMQKVGFFIGLIALCLGAICFIVDIASAVSAASSFGGYGLFNSLF